MSCAAVLTSSHTAAQLVMEIVMYCRGSPWVSESFLSLTPNLLSCNHHSKQREDNSSNVGKLIGSPSNVSFSDKTLLVSSYYVFSLYYLFSLTHLHGGKTRFPDPFHPAPSPSSHYSLTEVS